MAAVVAEGIYKAFAGTQALSDVNLRVEAGEIHGLLGANGSGKSTLVKVLTAIEQPDSGSLAFGDHRVIGHLTSRDVPRWGVRVVHQEAPLVDTLSVAESFALFRGYPRAGFGRIDWKRLVHSVRELFADLGIDVDPEAYALTLSPAERALVALAVAFDGIEKDGNLLILDEATASLQEAEASLFLDRVSELARRGIGVLMVTHRISEVRAIADNITLLANGRVAYRGPAHDVDEDFIISKMLGQPLSPDGGTPATTLPKTVIGRLWTATDRGEARHQDQESKPALEVIHLAGGSVADVSFSIQAGEIVGITGLPTSGVTDLPYLLAGSMSRDGGIVRVDGRELRLEVSPQDMISVGVALVPADRLRQGGLRNYSLLENVVLADANRYWHRKARERTVLSTLFDLFEVVPRRTDARFGQLSGGNQQKIVVGKWLAMRPGVLILDDPTSGVDPHSRRLIFDAVRAAAAEGTAVILLSNEHEQLVSMTSRVIVLRSGGVAAELTPPNLTRESIATWSYL